MIGDSIADIDGGKNYGAYTIAYLFNANKTAKVLDSKPNRSIENLSDLLEIVKENHYFTYDQK